MKNPTLKC